MSKSVGNPNKQDKEDLLSWGGWFTEDSLFRLDLTSWPQTLFRDHLRNVTLNRQHTQGTAWTTKLVFGMSFPHGDVFLIMMRINKQLGNTLFTCFTCIIFNKARILAFLGIPSVFTYIIHNFIYLGVWCLRGYDAWGWKNTDKIERLREWFCGEEIFHDVDKCIIFSYQIQYL